MNLVSYPLEFRRKRFDGSLDKQNIGRTAPGGFSMNFFRDLLQWTTVSVDANEERLRILTCAFVDKKTISGPNVYGDSFVRSNELCKSSSVNLSEGFTAD